MIIRIRPASWAASAEAESRLCMARCETCGTERSIRWQAAGNPKRMMSCPSCDRRTWHRIVKVESS